MIIDWFDAGARAHPDAPCLDDGRTRMPYREVAEATHRTANAIAAKVGRDSKVGLYSPNHPQAMVAALGTFRSGAVYVPLNSRDAIDDCAWFLDFAGCELLFFHSSFEANLPRLREAVPRLREFVCVDRDTDSTPSLATWSRAFAAEGGGCLRGPEDLAILKSTGGTTGRPKGVLQTHRCLEAMYRGLDTCMPIGKPPVHLLVAPITHAAGAIAYPLMAHGARQVFASGTDAGVILAAIERERVTHLFLPPTMIYRLLAHPEVRRHDYSSLEYFIYAAAPMSADKLREALEVFGPVMAQCFGQAEAPMICTFLSPAEHTGADAAVLARRLNSAGRAAPFTEVAIMDDAGRLLPPDENGEIVVRGDLVMPGYYKNAKASAEVAQFGWHHTGDIGRLDAEGYLTIVDRKRDMIITGGFNVYPREIEQVLWAHAAVQDCAVIGVPDDDWGEAVKAIVELKPGAQATAEELLLHCRERLGGIKAPKTLEFRAELPRSSVGKVLKRDLRERYWAGRDRRV